MANKTSTFKEYFDSVITAVLPPSAIKDYKLNRIGLHGLSSRDVVSLKAEENKFGLGHEKSSPDRYLLKRLDKDGAYSPTYLKGFSDPSTYSKLTKIIVNSALQLYPNPLNTYGMILEQGSSGQIGVATIDLNHLKNQETGNHVESDRLDSVLAKLGLPREINCFMDFQKLLENEAFVNAFTPRAIVQLGLESIFIPNAIGETDANSRNVILLKGDNGEKYDALVRIDADANVYVDEVCERGMIEFDGVPKGIYSANEPRDTFLKNISLKGNDVDWDLFMGFTYLAKEATSRTRVDNAITKAYMMNSGKLSSVEASPFMRPSPFADKFNMNAFYDFSEAIIKRAEGFSNEVLDAIGGRSLSEIPPFAEHISKYPNIVVESQTNPIPLVQEDQFIK